MNLDEEQLNERDEKYKTLYPEIESKFQNVISKTFGEFNDNFETDLKKLIEHLEKEIKNTPTKKFENLNSLEFNFNIEYRYLSIPQFDSEPKLSLLGNISATKFIKDAVDLIKANVNSIMNSENLNIELLNNNLQNISKFQNYI